MRRFPASLERNGIVERRLLSSRPVAVEYRITLLGKTLRPPVDVVLDWVRTYMPEIERARNAFDADDDFRSGTSS